MQTKDNDLFVSRHNMETGAHVPLARRMRPRTLEEFSGQEHILAPGKLLRRAIDADRISSLILYGPPGTGKTTLGYVISSLTQAEFIYVNSVASNVAQLRAIIQAAEQRIQLSQKKTIVFVDEIHRFNKAQQDVLMPHVENGIITLIGATTQNPFFSIVGPLLSRSLVFELQSLSEDDLVAVLERAARDTERGLGDVPLVIEENALRLIARMSDGDARRALNALEIGALTTPPAQDTNIHFTVAVASESIQKKIVMYDNDGDAHYDTASAFIKSMRGSDPDAALYWLAKMLYAGEDPRFIARRIVICAAEDVGNADPWALVVANAALQTSEFVGLPECRIPLAQAVTYIATAPKSNASYEGIERATAAIREETLQEVPAHLKDAHYPGANDLGHGEGYKYAHAYDGNWVDQAYMPYKATFYEPSGNGYEKKIKERMAALRKNRKE